MPTFDYKCSCGHKEKDILVFGSPFIKCVDCGDVMEKDFSTIRPRVIGDIEPHYNPSLGMVVKSRRDLRDKLWMTNSRTDDMSPTGGLTREERNLRKGIPIEDRRSIFEKRKDSDWGNSEMIDGVGLED
jgi:hypothetical protein